MFTNEQLVFNAMKKTHGDKLDKSLTPENLKFSTISLLSDDKRSASIYADTELVAEDQTWTKSNDDLERLKAGLPHLTSEFGYSEIIDLVSEGKPVTYTSNGETLTLDKGVYWDEMDDGSVLVLGDSPEDCQARLDALKGKLVFGDWGDTYPANYLRQKNGNDYYDSIYYVTKSTDFANYPFVSFISILGVKTVQPAASIGTLEIPAETATGDDAG